MDALKISLAEMMEGFNKRMADFEAELHNTPNTPSSTAGLASEFAAYRTFIVQALGSLQQQVEKLAHTVDNLEMQGRRKILLLHGVAELPKEDTAQVVADVVKQQLKMSDFTVNQIKRCHRMGKASTSQKPRPILFKMQTLEDRDEIWFTKTKLKGSGVTLSEFLTKARHDVFIAARDKLGVTKCWTKAGRIFVLGPDGSRHQVSSFQDLSTISPHDTVVEVQNTPVTAAKTLTARPRRAAATKGIMS